MNEDEIPRVKDGKTEMTITFNGVEMVARDVAISKRPIGGKGWVPVLVTGNNGSLAPYDHTKN